MPAVWKGSKQLLEQAGSPDYTETAAGEKIVRTFRGPYQALFSTRPRKGTQMAGFGGFWVDSVNIKPDAAGKTGTGTMVVTLANDYLNPDEPTTEIEWTEITRPAEQAPIFVTGGAKALTDDDLDLVSEWKDASTKAARAAVYTRLSANAKYFVGKLRRGQDSYVVFTPIVKVTKRSYNAPTVTKSGHKVAAPAGAPAGYEWFQNADRGIRQGGMGKWERSTEATGVEKVDTDFYPAA